MHILKEELAYREAEILVEAETNKEGGKNLFMTGIFIQAGIRNHNGRVYPLREIGKAVDDINNTLKTRSVLGECDHPEELTINLDRVSHCIVKMWMDGNNGMGKLKVLPTPTGNIIRTLIEHDCKLGVSSRGVGNVDDHGNVSDFECITVDIVCAPSGPECYPKPVYESLNSRRGHIIEDLARTVSHDPKAQKHLHKELINWIDRLKA